MPSSQCSVFSSLLFCWCCPLFPCPWRRRRRPMPVQLRFWLRRLNTHHSTLWLKPVLSFTLKVFSLPPDFCFHFHPTFCNTLPFSEKYLFLFQLFLIFSCFLQTFFINLKRDFIYYQNTLWALIWKRRHHLPLLLFGSISSSTCD